MNQYKYFNDVMKNAIFTDEECSICSSEKYCLEGVYFDTEEEYESICLECLLNGKVKNEIPDYIQRKLSVQVEGKCVLTSKEIKEKIFELSKTPPVPWIQYNDWPVCCCDFGRYLGEWTKEDLNNFSHDGNGKEYLLNILDDFTKSKVDDINVLWNDIEQHTAVFVFECIECSKRIAVCQSY